MIFLKLFFCCGVVGSAWSKKSPENPGWLVRYRLDKHHFCLYSHTNDPTVSVNWN